MIPFGMIPGGAGSSYQITNSVRLRASASAYFSRTFGAGGDRDKWWILLPDKRSTLGATQYLYGADTASADAVYYNASDKLCVDIAGTNRLISTRLFRDPSAWGAFLVVYDASNGTNALKLRVYYIDNGFAELTAWDTDTRSGITAGTAKTTLNTVAAVIGKNPTAASGYFDGYLSHFHIGTWSGSQPTPASFGSNDSNGVWVFNGTSTIYGTQGSWLDFKDANLTTGSNVGLGKDVSGNGNYWNTNNISVTAGVTYDAMVDTPTNNYATLNPIVASAANISYAALRSGTTAVQGTMEAAVFAGAYWEVTAAGSAVTAGVISGTGTTNTTTVTANKVFGFRLTGAGALDYINITDVGSWTGITTGLTAQQFPYGITQAADWNFGQRPFIGTASGKALCTANLPAVAIPKPALHFDAKTRTGTGAAFNVTGEAFSPGLVWSKGRSGATDHALYDIVRGVQKQLESNTTDAETTEAQGVTAFNSDGYSGGTLAQLNTNAATYVDWLWKAGGAGVSNTAGSITTTVSANTTAGFSIVTYTGNETKDATVGHGLSAVPKLIISKGRSLAVYDWPVHHDFCTTGYSLILNGTGAQQNTYPYFNAKDPSSTVFYLPGGADANRYAQNKSGETYVAYCFAEIAGFSKFGSYVGNGAADGTNVICGFSPRYVLIKSSTAVDDWRIYDSMRPGYNVIGGTLLADTAGAETTSAEIDFTANGFKLRVATTPNAAQTYIYAAFAAYPFGGSNVSPSPAR